MIINKRKCNPTCSKFKCNGSVIEDGKVIANKFNDFFFINVGPSLAKNIPSTKKNPTEYITQNIETVFAVSPVSDHEILKILGDLKDSAEGWDELRPNMIKHLKTIYKASNSSYLQFIFWYRCIPQWLKNSTSRKEEEGFVKVTNRKQRSSSSGNSGAGYGGMGGQVKRPTSQSPKRGPKTLARQRSPNNRSRSRVMLQHEGNR